MVYRLIRVAVAVPLFWLVFRPRVTGLERVPRTGPVILAANHLSLLDPVLLSTVLPRPVTYIAKAEWWAGAGLRGRAMAAFMTAIHQVPVDRSGGRAAAGALTAAVGVLGRGEVFGIFPEGTRSPDGLLHRGRTGVARIALATGACVVPVGLVGTDAVIAPGSRRLHRARPTVRFGEPIAVTADPAADRRRVRELTDRVVAAIGELSGQTYVATDARAASRAATSGGAGPRPGPSTPADRGSGNVGRRG